MNVLLHPTSSLHPYYWVMSHMTSHHVICAKCTTEIDRRCTHSPCRGRSRCHAAALFLSLLDADNVYGHCPGSVFSELQHESAKTAVQVYITHITWCKTMVQCTTLLEFKLTHQRTQRRASWLPHSSSWASSSSSSPPADAPPPP